MAYSKNYAMGSLPILSESFMLLYSAFELEFEIYEPTPFITMLRPRSSDVQWIVREEFRIDPHVPVSEFTDGYGNLCQRLLAPVGNFRIQTNAEIKVPDSIDRAPGAPFIEIQNLPENVLHYLLPSRYCESERFSLMAIDITAEYEPGYDQVVAIENWIRQNIHYVPVSSDIPITAVEVNQKGSGVCRDLAHLAIAMCRSLAIPSRLVVGYCLDLEPMDMHAWFEVYVGDRWYTFDAAMLDKNKKAYVSIGYGRDAADVAVYNQFGPAVYPSYQKVSVSRNKQM